MTHPRDMHMSALIYWIEQGMVDCFAVDFLSDRAQKSIVRFLAEDVQGYYKWVKDCEDPWGEYHPNPVRRYGFFYNSAIQHPLVAMFGETMARAIENAVRPVFADLEKGKAPDRAV